MRSLYRATRTTNALRAPLRASSARASSEVALSVVGPARVIGKMLDATGGPAPSTSISGSWHATGAHLVREHATFARSRRPARSSIRAPCAVFQRGACASGARSRTASGRPSRGGPAREGPGSRARAAHTVRRTRHGPRGRVAHRPGASPRRNSPAALGTRRNGARSSRSRSELAAEGERAAARAGRRHDADPYRRSLVLVMQVRNDDADGGSGQGPSDDVGRKVLAGAD